MSQNLERVSSNVLKVLKRTLYNESLEDESKRQIVSQLIKYDDENPFSQPILTKQQCNNLFLNRVFPYPLNTFTDTIKTDLRIYFPECSFDSSGNVEDYVIIFDIIVHKNFYMIRDAEGNTVLRSHAIAENIIDFFDDKILYRKNENPIYKLQFTKLYNLSFDNDFLGTRLVARYIDFVSR